MPKRKSYVISSIPELDHHAAEILEFGRRSLADIIEIGRRLVRCRELLKPQGCWLAWIKTKFGWSRAHADNLIAVFEARDRLLKFSSLPISALYLLAKRDPEFLLSIEHHVEAGEPVNARTLRVMMIKDREGSSIIYDQARPEQTVYPRNDSPPDDDTTPPDETVVSPPRYRHSPPQLLGPRPSDARIAADGFVERLTRLAQLVPGLDVAEVAAAVERYEGADMAVRVMADFLHALSRRLGERAPLELLASDSDTQH